MQYFAPRPTVCATVKIRRQTCLHSLSHYLLNFKLYSNAVEFFCSALFYSPVLFWANGGSGTDKIVWSVRFRRARRTTVRRAAKSGAEKAKTLNFKQESVRIPTPYQQYGVYYKSIIIACFRFFGPDDFSRPESGRDKKDAESSKIVTSPYKRTAETIFGGRKSENIKLLAGIRQDSDPLSTIWGILKINYHSLFSLFRSGRF